MVGRELWVLASGADEQSDWEHGVQVLGAALPPLKARVVADANAADAKAPDMIVLPHAGWPEFYSSLECCKQRWAGAAVLGLVPVEEIHPERLQEAYAHGLTDFVSAPVRMAELIARVRVNCGGGTPKAPDGQDFALWKEQNSLQALVGASPAFERALRKVPTLGATDATVLILGETGTGKELFARALHYSSRRKSAAFVPVNCAAVPEHLFENELFGHTRGAYTDARSDAPGLLEIAQGGTLFLDEVDSLSSAAQAKLLRLLQNREYRPLGSAETRRADIRVVAAANTDLAKLVKQGRLREDLYYRLNVLRIEVPPLRDRAGDILLLAEHFLDCLSRDFNRTGLRLGPGASSRLCAHGWPGNVREIESVMQRAVLMSAGPLLQPADLELGSDDEAVIPAELDGGSMKNAKAVLIDQFERNYLVELLKRCGGNVSQAARSAGKERRAFQRLLQKRGIKAS